MGAMVAGSLLRTCVLNPVDWQRVLEIFDEASEIAPRERHSWLESACGTDTALRTEVERLLHAADAEDGFLEQEIAAYADVLADAASPRRIGPYRVLEEIARGGMGAVYLAERADDHYQARVAIKLVHTGSLSHVEFQRRFLRERQILASLRHPNIAQLLDGGITTEGIPYLVMEFVDGLRIDEYCRRRALGVDERIRLFQRVCLAVQHAHRNLIVHRDIKPSNILVTAEGEPKLLDFGIAKNLAAPAAGHSIALTRPAQRVMTLEYASPEQFRGELVTTATDVYSLGILLYELLAGRHPFESERPDFLALQHAICEVEPPALSIPDNPQNEATQDLQYIVAKAIRKQPAARYESVQHLSDDLERYLDGYPVLARQGNRRYLAAKFIGRHRTAVISATAVSVLLVGAATGMAVLAANLARARDLADQQRERAETETTFLNSLFTGSDPFKQTGPMPTARDMLDRGAERILKELKSQPEVRADLLDGIAQAYQHLALSDRAEQTYREEAVAADQAFGPNSWQKAHMLRQLGDMERSSGDMVNAEKDLRQALAIVTTMPDGEDEEPAHVYNNLALLLQAKGQTAEAEADFRRAIAIAGRFPDAAGEAATMSSNLGALLLSEHRYPEAERIFRDTLAKRRQLLGENHPFVGNSLRLLASTLDREGHYHDAVALARKAMAVYQLTLQPGHPYYHGAWTVLAAALRDEGRLAEAESWLRQAVASDGKAENSSEALASDEAQLAQVLLLENRNAEGLQVAEHAVTAARNSGNAPVLVKALFTRAQLEASAGRDAVAANDVNEAIAKVSQAPQAISVPLSDALFLKAELLRASDRIAAAAAYKRSIEMDRGNSDVTSLSAHLLGYALFLSESFAPAGGEKLARESLDLRKRALDRDAWQTQVARSVLADVLARDGRKQEALVLANDSTANLERTPGRGSRPALAAALRMRQIEGDKVAGRQAEQLLCCTY